MAHPGHQLHREGSCSLAPFCPRPVTQAQMWTVTRLPLLLLHHHILKSHFPHSAHHHKDLLKSLPVSEPLLIHPPWQGTIFSTSASLHEAPREPIASSCLPRSLVGLPSLANTNCSRLRVAGPPCLLCLLPCIALSPILPFFLLMTQPSSLSWAGALLPGTWHPPALSSVLPPEALPLSQPSQSLQMKPRLLISLPAAKVL